MNDTRNMICVFLGGIAIGAFGTVGVMKKLGYSKPGTRNYTVSDQEETEKDVAPKRDVPSFDTSKKINTQKTRYHVAPKEDLEKIAKKYQDSDFDEHMADRESPEDDIPDEDEKDEEVQFQSEIGESLMEHPGQYEDGSIDSDGYGHIIQQLTTSRPKQLIYLVNENYAGEIYLLEELRYFPDDDVLIDENDAPIDDPDRIIGSALEFFGEGTEDPNRVFVRNASIGIEYEIVREKGTYGSYLYGIDEDDIPKRKRVNHPAKRRRKDDDDE